MMKIKHRRNRYQQGSLTTESERTDPTCGSIAGVSSHPHGQTIQRKQIIGTKKEYSTLSRLH